MEVSNILKIGLLKSLSIAMFQLVLVALNIAFSYLWKKPVPVDLCGASFTGNTEERFFTVGHSSFAELRFVQNQSWLT